MSDCRYKTCRKSPEREQLHRRDNYFNFSEIIRRLEYDLLLPSILNSFVESKHLTKPYNVLCIWYFIIWKGTVDKIKRTYKWNAGTAYFICSMLASYLPSDHIHSFLPLNCVCIKHISTVQLTRNKEEKINWRFNHTLHFIWTMNKISVVR